MQHVVCGFLSSDWLLTETFSGIQSSSLRETGMIAFTSAVLPYMFTEIIITHDSCTVKEIINRRHFEMVFFSDFFPEYRV